MEFIATESFVSPLKGFLTLPSGNQEKKRDGITCKLDDKPRLYVIGSIRKVNQKIAHLELGPKRYDSSDVVIEDAALKRHVVQRGFKKRVSVKVKERDQKVIQKSSGRGSEVDPSITLGKISQKKFVAEKDKLVELYQYPGYTKEEPTPLPNGVDLDEILQKVIRAQRKTLIGKTRWSVKMLYKFLSAPCIQAILLDSFWWQFLHLYHPDREIQGHLFERIAENYSRTLLGCHKVSNPEHIFTFFPSLLSQAVYTCFCCCFPRSWFNTHEFKAHLCDVFSEWLGGTLHAPGSFNKWDYSELEPERSRRENLLSGKRQFRTGCDVSFTSDMLCSALGKPSLQFQKSGSSSRKVVNKSIKKTKRPVSEKKAQQQHSKKEEPLSQFVSSEYQVKEDGQKDSWNKQQSSQKKKKLKIALLPRESHPACCGPEFTWHHLNIRGHSPLIQHFLEKRHALSKGGCDIFLPRREICKPIPESAQTYAEVIKDSFDILHQRHKAFTKTYLRHQREMRNFDQQCKDNQELFRQEMQEEMKRRQAQKQKELLNAEVLGSSEKSSTHLPRVSFILPT
ncbi:protein FAM227A isoform X2 [Sceloporus undulatus]|uniref:protein FAM227A isoform X2 n=1 Tax=Sceloporus undulatus TaxID=8520 RepID=UPI001C4D384B|nr:protein FAM227A isoform X2 [Sceloporus undulatus]